MVLGVEPVTTERLTLPLWTAEDVAQIRTSVVRSAAPAAPVAGRVGRAAGVSRPPTWHPDFPRQDDVDAASLWREGDPWGPRSIVRGVTVLGSIGFFGSPEAAAEGGDGVEETEVGYGLVREAWGWGFATEALRGLLVEVAGVRVRASVRPENAASLKVLAKAGFTQLRSTTADGELVMVRPAS